jgi:hypothetical protein
MRRFPALAFAVLVLTACGGDSPPGQGEAATTGEPAESSLEKAGAGTTPLAKPSTEAAPSTQPAVAAAPERFVETGSSDLALELSAPFDLAGFELHLAFDAAAFKAGQPVITDQLQGFMCAANPDIPGAFKYICASIPARKATGLLATVPIGWSGRPPTLADFTIEKVGLVDEEAEPAPAGTELVLRVEDSR